MFSAEAMPLFGHQQRGHHVAAAAAEARSCSASNGPHLRLRGEGRSVCQTTSSGAVVEECDVSFSLRTASGLGRLTDGSGRRTDRRSVAVLLGPRGATFR